MRVPILLLLVVLGTWSAGDLRANDAGSQTFVAASLQADQPDFDIDIDINRTSDARWYANPMWIAIGGLTLVALILLVVMASRGGGTTVIKE